MQESETKKSVGRPKVERNKNLYILFNKYIENTTNWDKSIRGFCRFAGINKSTFYDYIKTNKYLDLKDYVYSRLYVRPNVPKYKYKSYDKLGKYNQNLRIAERRKLDLNYRLRTNFSTLIRSHLRGTHNKKAGSKIKYLGYSIDELREHIESKFAEGMNWENYGEWHIDHIKPASLFRYDSYDSEAFKRCWDLSNLQPLWASENIRKSNRIMV